MTNETVNHPSHYNTGKIEVITFLEDQQLNFHLATAVAYICRAEHKNRPIEDLEKARWYLTREIQRRRYPSLTSKDAGEYEQRDWLNVGLVRLFHTLFNVPVGGSFGDDDRRALRRRLLNEEFDEYLAAERRSDLIEIADALTDMIVIIFGTALEYDIPIAAVFNEVMRTNLAKLGPDGKPIVRADGKVLKPDGWSPPDIRGAIDRAVALIIESQTAFNRALTLITDRQ